MGLVNVAVDWKRLRGLGDELADELAYELAYELADERYRCGLNDTAVAMVNIAVDSSISANFAGQ